MHWTLGQQGAQTIPDADGQRRHGPTCQRGAGKDQHGLVVAGLEGDGRQLREVAPLGHQDHAERRQERPPAATVLPEPALLFRGGLPARAPDDNPGQDDEEQARPDPNGLVRQEGDQRAGEHRDQTLDDEGQGHSEKDWQRLVAGREDDGGQRRFVGELDEEHDGEDGGEERQPARHRSSLRVAWSGVGEERNVGAACRSKRSIEQAHDQIRDLRRR